MVKAKTKKVSPARLVKPLARFRVKLAKLALEYCDSSFPAAGRDMARLLGIPIAKYEDDMWHEDAHELVLKDLRRIARGKERMIT